MSSFSSNGVKTEKIMRFSLHSDIADTFLDKTPHRNPGTTCFYLIFNFSFLRFVDLKGGHEVVGDGRQGAQSVGDLASDNLRVEMNI